MEPQLPTPHFGPENAPSVQPPRGGEIVGTPKPVEVQAPVEQGNETREKFQDGPSSDPVATQPAFTPPPLPIIDPAQSPTATPQDDTTPVSAADDDLIEKEWVEKAKKVVAETRNDPHAQDAAVGRLQADYLKKRYGKVVKLSNDG